MVQSMCKINKKKKADDYYAKRKSENGIFERPIQ